MNTFLMVEDNYPKVEYLGFDFLKDTIIICNLIFANQQVTIMQVWLGWKNRESGLLG
jgi:hypothetical protein